MSSKATPSVISSPESAAGATRSGSPDGPTSCPSGPAPFPVSRFRALDSDVAMPIEDTCGPLFSGSSPSADLQWSLESRLRATLDVNGSPEYALTWSTWDMPAGPPICRLRASAHRTSGNGSGGWPTPNAGPQNDTDTKWQERRAKAKEKHGNNGFGLTLGMAAQTAGWPTTSANDMRPYSNEALETFVETGNLNDVAALAGWATPTTTDSKGRKRYGRGNLALPGQAKNIPCADGKARRIEPGTFPLAHGVPNRVGRLRAYGNAIVPQVAAAFIRAYRDVREVA